MSRKQLRPYRETGSGLIELGAFRVPGDWEETGEKEFHESRTSDGTQWVEGNKKRAEFRLRFGKVSAEQVDALTLALACWRPGGDVPVPVTIGGQRFNFLYLHSILAEPQDRRMPVGLVFSNQLP